MNWKPTRRQLLAATAGLAGGALLSGRSAFAQTAQRPSALVIIHLAGGYNAMFSGADPFITYNHFGVTGSNVSNLGNGLIVDAATLGSLPADALTHMATIGNYHRFSGHESATRAEWANATRSYPLMLAAAMGGTAPIRCAVVGRRFPPGPRPEENGVSMQAVTDISPIVAALGGSTTDSTVPNRTTGAVTLMTARSMSGDPIVAHPNSLKSVKEGYDSAIALLQSPSQNLDYPTLAAAYGVSASSTSVSSFNSQLLAAELMIRTGCRVVIAIRSGDWDTHTTNPAVGDRDRAAMLEIMPTLRTFLTRMMGASSPADVTTVITGDFARSLPSSDHANFVSATVIGPKVKVGTTGRPTVTRGAGTMLSDGGTIYEDRCTIASTTPGVLGYWSYLATVVGAPTNPFGTNPHALVI